MSLKKMHRSRKSMLFNIILVIVAALALIYAFIAISEKQEKIKDEIGKRPMDAVMRMQEGEKALIFLDFAAKMAIYEAVYNLQSSGGISKSSKCGTYYDFSRWNSNTGQNCFADSKTAKESLKDLFITNLVARVAAYPSADFVGNVPAAAFSRGVSLSAQTVSGTGAAGTAGAAASTAAPSSCTGSKEFKKDFTYKSDSGFFPPDGSRLWIPAEANCQGSYPLVVFLHGCQKKTTAQSHLRFGDGHSEDIIPVAKNLIDKRLINPVILAAPSQTLGTSTYYDVPNSPCGSSLWGEHFDIKTFVDLVKQNLPQGITIASVSVMGHSGAGCSGSGGIHSAAQSLQDAVMIGQLDTCSGAVYGNSLKSKLGPNTKFIAVYSAMGDKRDEQNKAMGITKKVSCPSTDVPKGEMSECYSDSGAKYFGYTLKEIKNHGLAVPVGAEQLLKIAFPASAAASSG